MSLLPILFTQLPNFHNLKQRWPVCIIYTKYVTHVCKPTHLFVHIFCNYSYDFFFTKMISNNTLLYHAFLFKKCIFGDHSVTAPGCPTWCLPCLLAV